MFKYLECIFALVNGWLCIYHAFLHWKWEGISKEKLRIRERRWWGPVSADLSPGVLHSEV